MTVLKDLLADFNSVHKTLPVGVTGSAMADAARVFEIADFWVDPMAIAVGGDVFGKAQTDVAFLISVIDGLVSEESPWQRPKEE